MIIKYCDDSGNILREVRINEAETKALQLDMKDIVEWHVNFIKHRAKQNINKIVEHALKPDSKQLPPCDIASIKIELDKLNQIIFSPRDLPHNIKEKIVKLAYANKHQNTNGVKNAY